MITESNRLHPFQAILKRRCRLPHGAPERSAWPDGQRPEHYSTEEQEACSGAWCPSPLSTLGDFDYADDMLFPIPPTSSLFPAIRNSGTTHPAASCVLALAISQHQDLDICVTHSGSHPSLFASNIYVTIFCER